MSTDDLFRQIEPPRGGLERFARRLDAAAGARTAAPRWRPFAWAGAASVAAALVVAGVLRREPSQPEPPLATTPPAPAIYDSPAFDRLLGRPLEPEQLTAVVNRQPASVTELESQNDRVRIYQIN